MRETPPPPFVIRWHNQISHLLAICIGTKGYTHKKNPTLCGRRSANLSVCEKKNPRKPALLRVNYYILLILSIIRHGECYLTLSQTSPGFYGISLLKILWEKEKLLKMSNFSFSHSVFYGFEELSAGFINFEIIVCKLFQFGIAQNLSLGKRLTIIVLL